MKSEGVYDPETLALLQNALDQAFIALAPCDQTSEHRTVLACRILARASSGERDPERLCAVALLSLRSVPSPPLPSADPEDAPAKALGVKA